MKLSLKYLFKKQFPILLLFLPPLAFSQVLEGKVFAAKDSLPLQGVSIYFDGTSIGTTTNASGHFSLTSENATEIPLIISFLGYENVVVSNLSAETKSLPPIFLKEKAEELTEVIIAPDPWSRQKKLEFFRREFLGNPFEAQKVKIKNEDALSLRYNPFDQTLTVEAKEPLQVINRFLGYEVTYDLQSFKIIFLPNEGGLRSPRMVMYEGSSFFEELRKRGRKRFLQNRKSSYSGSPLHFMRALAEQSLTENDFEIYKDGFQVAPYQYFRMSKKEKGTEVELLAEKVSILYNDIEQSGLEMTGKIFIDALGNHSPPLNVIFSGGMSNSRITHLLPLDYRMH